MQSSPVCLPCSVCGAYVGLTMFTAWKEDIIQRTERVSDTSRPTAFVGCLQARHLIGIETGEPAAVDCDNWRQAVQSSIRKAEERRNEVFELWLEKRGEIDL